MKLVTFFSRLATFAFAAFVVGVVLNTQALAFFAFAVSAFVALVVAGDYAPATRLEWLPVGAVVDFSAPPAAGQTPSERIAA
jgi:hypothetical protein